MPYAAPIQVVANALSGSLSEVIKGAWQICALKKQGGQLPCKRDNLMGNMGAATRV